MAPSGDIKCSQCGDPHPEGTTTCPRTGLLVDGGPCGTRVDRYDVERFVAGGGMGAVYRARHALLAQPVALKLLKPQFARSPDILERFTREARAAAAIGNPHIIRVTDVGLGHNGQPFLVMELLEGQDLESLLRERGRLPISRALDIGLQMLDGLAAAHAANIVHRDLKPANVFLAKTAGATGAPRDFVKLLDFGISKMEVEERVSTLTKTGMVMGTPQYMAPEQFMGAHAVDTRADIYSAAVTIYQMLTGTLPFDAQSYERLVIQVCTETPKPLRTVAPEVPAALAAVIERAMAREPDDRTASARDLAVAIREAAPHVTASFAPIAFAQPQTTPTPRTRAISASDPPPASRPPPDFGSWPSATPSGSASPARPLVAPWPSVVQDPRTPLGGLSAPAPQSSYGPPAPPTPAGVYAPSGAAPFPGTSGPVTPYAVEAVVPPAVGPLASATPPPESGPGPISAMARRGATPGPSSQSALPRTGGQQQSYPQPYAPATSQGPGQAYAPQQPYSVYASTAQPARPRVGQTVAILVAALAFSALAGAGITAAYVFRRHRNDASVTGPAAATAFAAAQPPSNGTPAAPVQRATPAATGTPAANAPDRAQPAPTPPAITPPTVTQPAPTPPAITPPTVTQPAAPGDPAAGRVTLTPIGPTPPAAPGDDARGPATATPTPPPAGVAHAPDPAAAQTGPAAPTGSREVDVDYGPITLVGRGSFPMSEVRQALRAATPQIAMCGRHEQPLDHVRVIVIVYPNGDLFGASPDPTVEGGGGEFAHCVADAVEEVGHIPPGPNTANLIAQINVHMRWHR